MVVGLKRRIFRFIHQPGIQQKRLCPDCKCHRRELSCRLEHKRERTLFHPGDSALRAHVGHHCLFWELGRRSQPGNSHHAAIKHRQKRIQGGRDNPGNPAVRQRFDTDSHFGKREDGQRHPSHSGRKRDHHIGIQSHQRHVPQHIHRRFLDTAAQQPGQRPPDTPVWGNQHQCVRPCTAPVPGNSNAQGITSRRGLYSPNQREKQTGNELHHSHRGRRLVVAHLIPHPRPLRLILCPRSIRGKDLGFLRLHLRGLRRPPGQSLCRRRR